MTRRRLQRSVLLTCALLAVLGSGMGLWLRARQRQYALNQQLIAALVKGDDRRALALVKAGADPNIRYKPTPVLSLPQLLKQLFHRSPPPTNNSPTALMIACGATTSDNETLRQYQPTELELVLAMLRHGAKVNVQDDARETPLLCAVDSKRWNLVGPLLEHGADVNAKEGGLGHTPLMLAVEAPDTERLLLGHGARVNAHNVQGWTALHYAVEGRPVIATVRLLLQAGASVNAEEGIHGRTPLMLSCMSYTTPEAVRLLLKY